MLSDCATATTEIHQIGQKVITWLLNLWSNPLKSLDAAHMACLYDENAVMMPTLSITDRHNHAEIIDNFKFLPAFKLVICQHN